MKRLLLLTFLVVTVKASEVINDPREQDWVYAASFLNSYVQQKYTVEDDLICFAPYDEKEPRYMVTIPVAVKLLRKAHKIAHDPQHTEAVKNMFTTTPMKEIKSSQKLGLQILLYSQFLNCSDRKNEYEVLLNRAIYHKLWLSGDPDNIASALEIKTHNGIPTLKKVIKTAIQIDAQHLQK